MSVTATECQAAPTADAVRGLIETLDVQATGSRVISPQCVPDASDWDFIALVEDLTPTLSALLAAGFTGGASMTDAGEVKPTTKFISLRRESLNIIATSDKAFFAAFMLATRTAARLGLTVRTLRVTLFQAILYGNG